MGQFRMIAVVALAWTSAASAANLGMFYITLTNVQTQLIFERTSKVGNYVQVGDASRFDVSMQTQAPGSEERSRPSERPVLLTLQEIDQTKVNITRRGNDAELQVNSVVLDPSIMMKIPVIEARKISLKPGQTWQEIETSGNGEAFIDIPKEQDEADRRKILENLAQVYFDHLIAEGISARGAIVSSQEVEILSLPEQRSIQFIRDLKLKKDLMILSTKGGSLQIRAKVQTLEPTPRKRKPVLQSVSA